MSAPADHVIDVARQVETFWPHNEHVAEEMLISRLLDDTLGNLFPNPERWAISPGQFSIEPGVLAYSTRVQQSFFEALQASPITECGGRCDRCAGHSPGYPVRRLWVPTGSRIIEFHCCVACVDYLNAEYAPVVWR